MPQEPLTNAAVEWMRSGHARLNALDAPPSHYVQTDDFVAEDRRTHTGGVHFGTLDRAGFAEFYNLSWELGARMPHFSITVEETLRTIWSKRWSPFVGKSQRPSPTARRK